MPVNSPESQGHAVDDSCRAEQEAEVERGERYRFGDNWRRFLRELDEDRIARAQRSIEDLLGASSLAGLRFLDVGCGSGLFSLAARRLGADVTSFDFDRASVACTESLKASNFSGDPRWQIQCGSVLDDGFLRGLGRFDVVYAWGVLHHTGEMWRALDLTCGLPNDGGRLVLALYNDQGLRSRLWHRVKRVYCSSRAGQVVVKAGFYPYFASRTVAKSVLRRENAFASYRRDRGMSIVRDWDDWLGGLPFEVATPMAVELFVRRRGFVLDRSIETRSLGNNQFVFRRR